MMTLAQHQNRVNHRLRVARAAYTPAALERLREAVREQREAIEAARSERSR